MAEGLEAGDSLHAGDMFDFAALRNDASQEEKSMSMADDYKAGMSFAKRFFAGGETRWFLQGNHDCRLWELLHKQDGVLRDFADQKTREIERKFREWGVKILPYDARKGVLKIGKMQVIHGYKSGINATRQHAMIYRNVIMAMITLKASYRWKILTVPRSPWELDACA